MENEANLKSYEINESENYRLEWKLVWFVNANDFIVAGKKAKARKWKLDKLTRYSYYITIKIGFTRQVSILVILNTSIN